MSQLEYYLCCMLRSQSIYVAIAVTSGRVLRKRISKRQLTFADDFLFLAFAVLAVIKINT